MSQFRVFSLLLTPTPCLSPRFYSSKFQYGPPRFKRPDTPFRAVRASWIGINHHLGAALASRDAESALLHRVAVLAERRDALVTRLRETGWDVPDAQGNFVWLPAGDRALEVAAAFEEAGLIVRPFAGDGIRISVGEEESIDRLVEVAASVAPR